MARKRLPINVARDFNGGCGFKTTIITASSGHEQRIIEWDIARGRWNVSYPLQQKSANLASLIATHKACFGKAYSFEFRDWSDYEATDEPLATGDGSTTAFQLRKTYYAVDGSGSPIDTPYISDIAAPDLPVTAIKLDGVVVSSSDYSISDAGVVTFNTAPGNGVVPTWTGQFFRICRFDIDAPGIAMQLATVGSVSSFPVIEVIGE